MSASGSSESQEAQAGLITSTAVETDDRVVVHVQGELDLSTVDQFMEVLDDAFEAAPAEVVLDLRDLRFIDSSGVGAYVAAYRRAQSRQIDLVIGERSPVVNRVLELSGVEEALRAESGSSGPV